MTAPAVLVTGGAGFIGSHACKALAASGALPVTVDNLVTGHRDAVKWGPFHELDVRDTQALRAVMSQHGTDTVMHFAASAYVGESVSNPGKYYANNLGGMISVLDACRSAGVRHFILSSSCATYGVPDKLPIAETTPQQPINPYGRSKLWCEQMLADHDQAWGLGHVVLRYFNAAGADPDGDLTERHDPETHLIPLALMAAAGLRGPLDIFGDDYPTEDGTCIRDYVHVTDLARGHVAAWQHLRRGGGNLSLNLGTGRGQSVLGIVRAIREAFACDLPVAMKPRRTGDPAALVADASRARKNLGFDPIRSDILSIIRDAAPGFGLKQLEVAE